MSDLDCKGVYPKEPRYTKKHGDFLTNELNKATGVMIEQDFEANSLRAKIVELEQIICRGKEENERFIRMLNEGRAEIHASDKYHKNEIESYIMIISEKTNIICELRNRLQIAKQSAQLSVDILEREE